MTQQFLVADLFCGAGGSSTGAERAIRAIGGEMLLVAVNHWPVAIETHQRNHPNARHYVEDVTAVDPEELVPEGELDLLMASPECRYYSRARGGKPVGDQGRMNPWVIQRWLSALNVRCLLVENVPEYCDWGPLQADGRPDRKRKGLYFQAWVQALWAMGYAFEWRFLNAADHGDATTRVRFFGIGRRDGQPIRWPEPTHSATGRSEMFGRPSRWRAAREIIDWSNPGRSLLDDPKYQRRPLSEKTRRRIARGLERFGGELAPLYISLLGLESGDANGSAVPSCEPFMLGQQSGSVARSTEAPLPTVTTDGAISLVQPVLAQYNGNSNATSVDDPLPTVTTRDRFGLAAPMAIPYGPRAEARTVEEPLPTILTKDRLAVATPVIVPYYGDKNGRPRVSRSVDEPLATITAEPRFGLMQPFLVPQFGERDGQAPRVHDVDHPVPAVTSHGAGALVEPVLVQTDQTGSNGGCVRPVDVPLPTIVTKQTMALIEPILRAVEAGQVDPRRVVLIDGQPFLLDIRFRMLNNRELARAMGFDDTETTYEFTGTAQEITRQIGNAVPVNLAAALVAAILEPLAERKAVPA